MSKNRIQEMSLACKTLELDTVLQDVEDLKKHHADARRRLVGMIPACSLESESMIEEVIDMADKPKILQAELDAVAEKKLELEQQVLLQEKNCAALSKLSSGQSLRIEALEKDIQSLDADLAAVDELCHVSRTNHQDWMNKIQSIRDYVRLSSSLLCF
ncbi:hypothetical protein ACHHYP_04723 [Achlya hypogyna]|uniref:Uncharacterized protein n=1 Tax=Achlya hypogyna TaxID=1202772 RepID=A0A1V9Z029_ACHHY|nr:hypothetical protein ACHHYP_04723 [Achlya hypogyna]